MANEVLIKSGTQIVFRGASGFSPTAANDLRSGTPTLVDLSMASVANTAARQSAKVDLGATRAAEYEVLAVFELAATPTAGNTIEIYWANSPIATAGTGNPGGVSGTDAAYTGYSSNIAASVKQLILAGIFVCTAQATTTKQIARCGRFSPGNRYGSLVVVNNSGAAVHSNNIETHIVLVPLIEEIAS